MGIPVNITIQHDAIIEWTMKSVFSTSSMKYISGNRNITRIQPAGVMETIHHDIYFSISKFKYTLQMYSFTLAVKYINNNSISSTSTMYLETNNVPRAGKSVVIPSQGLEMSTIFTICAHN